ncbi:hypothetical protein FC093_03330 [Ilyomonas limi]|uniref:Copper-binding protein MbnP-like domain-containing protein n=1 Tax=Ilyomonas limi TaxID=2575867 RepID=A0A4U3L686_9BACT|nr:MbnP family protein [Ilyomonas limi]TKK70738.1 hypothetical protein FC093_03330 [Ilyomonas limi]
MKKCLLLIVVIISVCIAFSQKGKEKPASQTIRLIFQNMVGDASLQTGIEYTNAFGEPFMVRAFKYYISDMQLQYADSTIYKTNLTPHLVNERDSTTKQLSFIAPAGNITAIQFLLGVDSITNTTGVQTGDLDPAKGMYWVWNTGYIMAKLEGTSAVAKSPGRQFSYDVGGYKYGENAARKIDLPVPAAFYQETSLSKSRDVIIKADVLKWFAGTHDVKIAEHPMCHEPGKLAMDIADNYEKMFTF